VTVTSNGQTCHRMLELCDTAGATISTLLPWLDKGASQDMSPRDRGGWRLLNGEAMKRLKAVKSKVNRCGLPSPSTTLSHMQHRSAQRKRREVTKVVRGCAVGF